MFFFTFPYDALGQVWHLIVLFPDLCLLSYIGFCLRTLTLLQEFVCKTYASPTSLCKVSDLILLSVFMVKKGDADSSQLPPCQDTLMLHAMQADYQVCIWKRFLKQETDTPIPEGHYWMIEDSQIVIDWMQGLPVPQVVSRECKVPDCQCAGYALACLPV